MNTSRRRDDVSPARGERKERKSMAHNSLFRDRFPPPRLPPGNNSFPLFCPPKFPFFLCLVPSSSNLNQWERLGERRSETGRGPRGEEHDSSVRSWMLTKAFFRRSSKFGRGVGSPSILAPPFWAFLLARKVVRLSPNNRHCTFCRLPFCSHKNCRIHERTGIERAKWEGEISRCKKRVASNFLKGYYNGMKNWQFFAGILEFHLCWRFTYVLVNV